MTETGAARRLLGCELERLVDGVMLRARTIETEALGQEDEAGKERIPTKAALTPRRCFIRDNVFGSRS